MRTKLNLLICLAAAALFVAACSSTTVVASDDRAAEPQSPETTSPSNADDSEPAPTNGAADSNDGDSDEAIDDEPSNDEPGDVESGDEPPAELEPIDGFGLGGADQLASLLIDCEAGSDLACDVLFQISEFDSVEEIAASTCGGRSEATVIFCTEGITNDGDSFAFDAASEGIDAVVSLCTDDGDMTACDFLYYRSPLASELEDVGATCGGRVPVAVPDCRTFLAESE